MDGPRLCVVLARCRKRPRPARLAVSSARRERGSGGGRRGGAAGGEPAHGCLHVARPITLAHWVDTDVGRIRRVQRRAREVVCRHKLRNAHCQKAHRARSARTGARLLTKLNMFGGGYFRLDTNPLLPVRFAKEHFVNTKEPVSCVLTKCSFVFTKCSSDFHIFRTKPWQRRRSKCHELPLTLAILRMRFRIAWSRSKPTTVKMNGTAVHHAILLLVACATRCFVLWCTATPLKVELYQQNLWQLSNRWKQSTALTRGRMRSKHQFAQEKLSGSEPWISMRGG